jgi:hypothetical protein
VPPAIEKLEEVASSDSILPRAGILARKSTSEMVRFIHRGFKILSISRHQASVSATEIAERDSKLEAIVNELGWEDQEEFKRERMSGCDPRVGLSWRR